MKIEELYEGRVFKNYRVMCEVLGIEQRGGGSKISQINQLKRYCDFERDKQKYIITKIFESPKPYVGRGGVQLPPISVLLPSLAAEWDTIRNGTKIHDNVRKYSDDLFWWICSDCKNPIYTSVKKRLSNISDNSKKKMKCPFCSLTKGEKMVANYLIQNEIKFVTQHTFEDLRGDSSNLRVDFALLDHKDRVKSIIEYDGEFHYMIIEEMNTAESLKTVQEYDLIKNSFCKRNNIPLLRIPFYKFNNMTSDIEDFLNSVEKGILSFSLTPKECLEGSILLNELIAIEEDANRLRRKSKKIRSSIKQLGKKKSKILEELSRDEN